MDYLERLRTEHMKKGICSVCGNYASPLERHHESYSPERTLMLCHKCHFKAHFTPWELTTKAKEKLLRTRHGFTRTVTEDMIRKYVPPGRRESQLKVRRKLREGFR